MTVLFFLMHVMAAAMVTGALVWSGKWIYLRVKGQTQTSIDCEVAILKKQRLEQLTK